MYCDFKLILRCKYCEIKLIQKNLKRHYFSIKKVPQSLKYKKSAIFGSSKKLVAPIIPA